MPFCGVCGTEVSSRDHFCPTCGSPVNTPEDRGQQDGTEDENGNFSSYVKHTYRSVLDTEDHTSEFDELDIEDNKGFALMAYLGLLILVPVFGAHESRYARFHVSQGLNLLLSFLLFSAAMAVMLALLSWIPMFQNVFTAVFDIAEALAGLICLWLMGRGIIDANKGRARELPIVGGFRILSY